MKNRRPLGFSRLLMVLRMNTLRRRAIGVAAPGVGVGHFKACQASHNK